MKIYNTLTRKKEHLEPKKPGEVNIYACGPTVYNYIHIGNARPLCVFDVLRRYLEYRGMKVNFVQNFTDIDDKIIQRAKEEGTDYQAIAAKYIEEFWTDAKGMQVREATAHPRATENMEQIQEIISGLIAKDYAYEVQGDVYFRTKQFHEYGKLSHQPLEELEAGARIMVGDVKQEPMDFALWKAAKPGEPYWDSPWGKGRPGWHIECSAMVMRYLGPTVDIHCGGQDLIFPHHENEIAQSECFSGKPFAKYWMHNGYINVDNVKMSKSLGNFFTVRDVAAQFGYEPIRYFLISSHYRSPINYTKEVLEQSVASLARIHNCRENLDFATKNMQKQDSDLAEDVLRAQLTSHQDEFINAMEDDLNTADALAAIFALVRDINTKLIHAEVSQEICTLAGDLLDELCDVLGIAARKAVQLLDADIAQMIEARTQARKERDWAEADRIRDALKEMGVVLEDTPMGVKWSREQ